MRAAGDFGLAPPQGKKENSGVNRVCESEDILMNERNGKREGEGKEREWANGLKNGERVNG